MNITLIDPKECKHYEKNTKKHPKKQIEKIKNSIKEFGFNVPVILDKDNYIIAGHGRVLAATKLELKEIPVIYKNDLTAEQIKAYRIADNKTAESDWDDDYLKEELQELLDRDYDLEFTGFDSDELDLLLEREKEVVEDMVDVNAYERAKAKTKIQKGDIYILGEHRLMCGDSNSNYDVKKLMNGNKADMIFTDPPYGIDYSGGRTQIVREKEYGKIEGDEEKDNSLFAEIIMKYIPTEGDAYICISPINILPVLNKIKEYDGIIVWKKNAPGLEYQWIRRYCEFIIFKSTRKKKKEELSEFDFWEISTDNKTEYKHGTQKPVALSGRAIKFSSKEKDIVLDFFGGSGSTLIAAEQLNRRCYMMELDPVYCQVIIDRWSYLTERKAEKV